MILSEPAPSQGDLHFRVLNFPVRINPFFWVITLIFGLQSDSRPASVFIWMVAVLVSILIHELGHAIFQRRFGGNPKIILYGMGGLAICGDCDRSTRSQILISLAGPVAGFVFACFLAAIIAFSGRQLGFYWDLSAIPFEFSRAASTGFFGGIFVWEPFTAEKLNLFLSNLFFINILWGAVNLLPVYPLDGGHVARELCVLGNPRQGIILSLKISIVAAIAMAVVGIGWESLFMAVMFGYLAYSSYQILKAYEAQSW